MTPKERVLQIIWGSKPLPTEIREAIVAIIREAVVEEHERCAKIAESVIVSMQDEAGFPPCCERTGARIAAEIRRLICEL